MLHVNSLDVQISTNTTYVCVQICKLGKYLKILLSMTICSKELQINSSQVNAWDKNFLFQIIWFIFIEIIGDIYGN